MKMLDTNMILRFLLCDDRTSAFYVRNIIKNESVMILPEVVAEVIYVMYKVYDKNREDISNALTLFLTYPNVLSGQKTVLLKGLHYYKTTSLDFVDCLLCAYQTEAGYEVCTFDKKLKNLIQRETAD